MPIEKETIEAVKSGIDLAALVQSRGIELKKNGKGLMGLCPFHNDTHPSFSVNPSTNLWQCFGCGAGGDVIRFVELFDKVDFPRAIKTLTTDTPQFTAPKKTATKKEPSLTVKDQKLLARVADYYQHTFAEHQAGAGYLKNIRGIRHNQSLKDFGTGYVNGTLPDILPEDDAILSALKKIGILNKNGRESFYNCVVFPLYDAKGSIVNLYGRSIDEENHIPHLYLPGKRRGLVKPARGMAKRTQTVLLTESVIDALTLYDQGFKNVVPIYGVNGLIDDHLSFFRSNRNGTDGIKEAYLVFDADDAGRNAAESISRQLKEKKIVPHIVNLPVKDVNLYFKRHTPEEFERLLKQANPGSLEQSNTADNRTRTLYQKTDHGFIAGYGNRQYQVKGIQRGDTRLKAVVKASKDVTGPVPFELTTVDLYSSRSRIWFAKLCADLFGVSEALIREDIDKLLSLVEQYRPKETSATTPEPTKAQKQAAMKFLKNPNLFEEILSDLETIGVTGEETNKLVGYLAAVSRKLDDPLSVLIQSRSAAGKSTLQDAVLSLVPEEDYVKYTRITDQALFYKDENSLVNKILAIEEETGMGGAAYSIRNIQSSKKITVAATGKDPGTGKMKTEEYTVKGPVAVMITTTAAELEGETASRFLFLTIDESGKMTRAIHEKQRAAETLDGLINRKKSDRIIQKHQTAQRLLRPLAVVNPYSPYLSYPDRSIRTRRDHKKYLGLIRAVAFLCQYQRKINTVNVDNEPVAYIEVTLDDIKAANRLAKEVLGQSMDELARPSQTLLTAIYEMVKEISDKSENPIDEVYFTRRMIREHIGWTDWQVRTHIKQLEDMEYLYVRMGAKGKQYAYALNYKGHAENTGKCYLNLTSVDEIKQRIKRKAS